MTSANQAVTQAPARTPAPKKEDFGVILNKQRDQLIVALGSQIPIEYFVRVALTTFRKNPLIQQCSTQSILACLQDIAQLRLLPDNLLGEAYLVPFWNGRGGPEGKGCYEAQTMIGYKGLLKMVRRNKDVINVTADVVYEEDTFIFMKGSNHRCEFTPALRVNDRGDCLGAFAYIAYKDGGEDFDFVDMTYLKKVEAASRGSEKDSSPWKKWWEEMAKKTALRHLCKTADISPDVAEALEKDLATGAIDVPSEVLQHSAPQPSALAAPEEPTPSNAPQTGGGQPPTPPAGTQAQNPPSGPDSPSALARKKREAAAKAAEKPPTQDPPANPAPAEKTPPQGQPAAKAGDDEASLFGDE